jgi:hypothetical protein
MFEGNKNEPLIKNEYENNLKTIEELYLNINNDLKNLEKIYNSNNNELPFQQNNYIKYKLTLKLNFNKLFSLYKLFENSQIENSILKTKIKITFENLKNLNKKYYDFQYYLENLEKRMIENVPFYQIDLNSNFINENNEFNNIKVYENNETMLKKTEEIKNVSNTVSQSPDDIKIDVNKQEENLNYIEENVYENYKKRKSKKKFLILFITLVFLILLILYLFIK